MAGNKTNLSHEEIWDDSALIDSWNDALAEYKKYHSIHRKGVTQKDVDNLISEQAAKSETRIEADQKETHQGDMEVEEDEESTNTERHDPSASSQAAAAAAAMPPPKVMLGSIKDESLKKLLMSWYYAGYYTGLYEGQQQAQQHSQS